ncbi:hypothetical protein KEM48_008193 [Puccinia striiformis f. sp. tritici PST-130]|nr:hypothetical protein H4Q26_008652 [Puccinia striiformis f. sp. tritici PST-130]KAI9620370.1 hypothetical protein KEM48_008193 [Puccinia striiformis f. sp. tritici PST-130]
MRLLLLATGFTYLAFQANGMEAAYISAAYCGVPGITPNRTSLVHSSHLQPELQPWHRGSPSATFPDGFLCLISNHLRRIDPQDLIDCLCSRNRSETTLAVGTLCHMYLATKSFRRRSD